MQKKFPLHTILLPVSFLILSSMTECSDSKPTVIEFTSIDALVCDFTGPDIIYEEGRDIFNRKGFAIRVQASATTLDGSTGSEKCDNPLKHPVIDIRIITINDFDDEHKAGDKINELFGIAFRNQKPNISWPERGSDGTFISYGHPFYEFTEYAIRSYPEQGEYKFKVEYELSDGTILTSETPTIMLY